MGVFDGSIGPFVVGTFLALFLNGITVSQVFKYYKTFKDDRLIYRVMVGALCVADLFHSMISAYTVYLWCVSHFTDLAFLATSPWSFAIEPALTGIVTSVVQFFYAYRVYVIGKRSIWIPLAICAVSALQLGFACGATGMIFHLQYFERFQTWTYGVMVWLFGAAVADLFITSSLVYYLRGSKAEWQRTNSTVDHIIRMTVETNGLTLAVAITDAILFAASPLSWHVIPQLTLVKLYFTSLLVSLNSRASVAARLAASSAAYPSTRVLDTEPRTFGSNFVRSKKNGGVRVTVEETIMTDKGDEKLQTTGNDIETTPEATEESTGGALRPTTPRRAVKEQGW